MANVKLGFSGLTNSQKLIKAEAVVAASTDNPHFPAPQPKLTALSAARYNANLRTAGVGAARAALDAAEQAETAAFAEVDTAYGAWGDEVQSESGGDAGIIASAGFDVASTDRAPIIMTAPDELSVTAGDEAGEVDISCDPVRGARTYEVQGTTDLTGATGWQTVAIRSKSRISVKNLISGTNYAFRIRAIGAGDPGPWSIIVQKMAP